MRTTEGFLLPTNFPNDPSSVGTAEIKKYYSSTLPNILYNKDPNMDIANITKTANVRQFNSSSVLNNDWKKDANIATNGQLSQQQAACEAAGNGDQFAHLTSLANSVDTNSRLRCGWVYGNPHTTGRGALGITSGPLNTSASGTWMWDLNEAKKKYHTDICKNARDCGDIGASMYQGRCGWCKQSGKAVPINGSVAAYPFSNDTACPTSKLVTSSGSCTQGFTNPNEIQGFTNPSACTPLANGAFSRNCLLQKVAGAGCSDAGSLYQALQSGSDNDYTNVLRQQQAWSVYQQRATLPLDDNALKTGKITIADALNNFSRVQDQASSSLNGGLQYAARDLCFEKGKMDVYDFCSEIPDSNYGPFPLDCLQKSFMKAGGQNSGRAYPSSYNASKWNAIGSWAGVKAAIQKLYNDTRSTDRVIQENAMMDFYGIRLEDKQAAPLFNVTEASYGVNCNPSLRGNRTQLFQNLINSGTDLRNYSYDFTKTGGDPAGGCAKTLEIKYNCANSPTKTATVPAEAGYNGQVRLNCNTTSNLTVRLGQNCDSYSGWQKNIGVGDWAAGSGFPGDASFITVPEDLTAILTNAAGQTQVVKGPAQFNFCSRGGFNDRVQRLQVVAS